MLQIHKNHDLSFITHIDWFLQFLTVTKHCFHLGLQNIYLIMSFLPLPAQHPHGFLRELKETIKRQLQEFLLQQSRLKIKKKRKEKKKRKRHLQRLVLELHCIITAQVLYTLQYRYTKSVYPQSTAVLYVKNQEMVK